MSGENLFEQDLSKMDYMQLAGWLTACYEEVEIIRDENPNDEDYFLYLNRFIDAWEHHYEQNKGLYSSDKFKKARLFITYRNRAYLKVDYGKGRNSIQTIPYDTYENIHASQFTVWKPEVFEMIEQDVSVAYKKILSIFNPENVGLYKGILHEVVSEQIFTKIDIKVRAENEKGKKIREMTYQEFLDVCEKNDTYQIIPEKHERRSNYNAALDACGVASSTYHEFHRRRTSHKDFDKKFFINMGFALALPYESIGFMTLLFFPLLQSVVAFINSSIIEGIIYFISFVIAVLFFVFFVLGDKDKFKETIFTYEGLWERLSLFFMYVPFIYRAINILVIN